MSASDVKMSGILYQCTMQNAFGMGNRNIAMVFSLPIWRKILPLIQLGYGRHNVTNKGTFYCKISKLERKSSIILQ